MSRIGKMPIPLPDGVEVKISKGRIEVKGPKGKLSRDIVGNIKIKKDVKELRVVSLDENPKTRAFHGLMRTLINNMVVGVSQGFKKNLKVSGVGYRAQVSGNKLVLNVGYSHPIEFPLPEGISASVSKDGVIEVSGIDKQVVGDVAARIRKVRPPDAYKGKGIRYVDEHVVLKPGKSAVKA
ncbi:MAG TPA: 50S ribosomal protein L6 [Deltaproteobacteria bacterium]|nr:50S ribosomal protein L6 [Deltaproteobacteria bacterium]